MWRMSNPMAYWAKMYVTLLTTNQGHTLIEWQRPQSERLTLILANQI